MSSQTSKRSIFDPLLGFVEDFVNDNAAEVMGRSSALRQKIAAPIHSGLGVTTTREQQFELIQKALNQAEALFASTIEGMSKEILMAIARRAPSSFLDGGNLLLASLIVKYSTSYPARTATVCSDHAYNLVIPPTEDDVWTTLDAIAIASSMNNLRGTARWLGKGGKLFAPSPYEIKVALPTEVTQAVEAYEARRPGRLFDAGGFFCPQPVPKNWSNYRIPIFQALGQQMVEAPIGSQRWLAFERYATQIDGGGLARLLRGYDDALLERWNVGADPILHVLTALSVLIFHSSPKLAEVDGHLGFIASETAEATEHRIGFAFGLARKGFLRFPKSSLPYELGRVRSPLAPDQEKGERLANAFLDAFLIGSDRAQDMDVIAAKGTPFFHLSADDQVYIDLLLVDDFLAGVIEGGKDWYASQHGDRFVLDLKRWLDEVAPGSVVGARIPVQLPDSAGRSDVDLLVRRGNALITVECKAYAKSRDFMIGAPRAISDRRGKIREAARQARRTFEAFRQQVAAGQTEFPTTSPVEWLVCSPTVEFLKPFSENGMFSENTPRIVTPEELLEILRPSTTSSKYFSE